MSWILNAWRWLRFSVIGIGWWDKVEWADIESRARQIAVERHRESLVQEIARLRKNKKKFSHLQAELDNLK